MAKLAGKKKDLQYSSRARRFRNTADVTYAHTTMKIVGLDPRGRVMVDEKRFTAQCPTSRSKVTLDGVDQQPFHYLSYNSLSLATFYSTAIDTDSPQAYLTDRTRFLLACVSVTCIAPSICFLTSF